MEIEWRFGTFVLFARADFRSAKMMRRATAIEYTSRWIREQGLALILQLLNKQTTRSVRRASCFVLVGHSEKDPLVPGSRLV